MPDTPAAADAPVDTSAITLATPAVQTNIAVWADLVAQVPEFDLQQRALALRNLQDPEPLQNPSGAGKVNQVDSSGHPLPEVAGQLQNLSQPAVPELGLIPPVSRAATRPQQPIDIGFAQASSLPPDAAWLPIPARVTGDAVHLRRGPAITDDSITQFDAGSFALIHETRGPWHRVRIEGETGWMFGQFLSPDE